MCVFLPPAPRPPIPPGRPLSRRGPRACHGEGACAQALPEPRRDYLARLPGGRKTPQQPAGGVEEVATQWCGTQPTVKDRSTNSGAQRPTKGVKARLPPRCPPATGTTSHGCSGPYTRVPVWWESGWRVVPPGCAVTEHRCAWHQRRPSRHSQPRWHLLSRSCPKRTPHLLRRPHAGHQGRHVSQAPPRLRWRPGRDAGARRRDMARV